MLDIFTNPEQEEKRQNETILRHVGALLDIAKAKHPTNDVAKHYRYYSGSFTDSDYSTNQRNVIKGIVEAKTTLVLDAQISTSVVPKVSTFSSLQKMQDLELEASILDDAVKNIFHINNEEILRQKCTRAAAITGFGVYEIIWDGDFNFGLGDVKINFIEPSNFYCDPECNEVNEANYIFIKENWSLISLKAKYPQYADKIKALVNKNNSGLSEKKNNKPNSIQTVQTDASTSMVYGFEKKGDISDNAQNVTVWKCYLKDDTTWQAEKTDTKDKSGKEKEELEQASLKYPYGRVILFCEGAKDWILEDKEIDYPFGFPIEVFNWIDNDSIYGDGEVKDLCEIQDRINGTYLKLREVIRNSNKWILNDKRSGLTDSDFINAPVLNIDGKEFAPDIFDNTQISDIAELLEAIRMYKQDAMEISRVNESIVSGIKPKGVTSGKQLEELNESPMASIRAIQRNYKCFSVSVTNKVIALIQKYYNIQRLVRISDGDEIAVIQPRDEQGGQQIDVYQKQDDGLKLYKSIKSNFAINQYDVDVIAGTEVPRSPQERANLTMKMFEMGLLPQGIEGVRRVLNDIDYPNRYAILQELQKQAEESKQAPPPVPFKELAMNFKDLPVFAQAQFLQQIGFQIPDGFGQGISNPDLPLSEQAKEKQNEIQMPGQIAV